MALAEPRLCAALVISAQLPGGSRAEHPGEWSDAELGRIVAEGGGTPDEVLADPQWREHVFRVLRADLSLGTRFAELCRDRVPEVPVTVLGGAADRLVPAARLDAWRTRVAPDARIEILPGGHFYLLDPENTDTVAGHVLAALDDARATAAS